MTRWASIVILCALCTLCPSAARATPQTCTIVKLEKQVDVKRGGGPWTAASEGLELAAGDEIHTGFKATAQVKFADGSVVTVKSMTMLRLSKLEQNGTTVSSTVMLRLGEIKASVGDSPSLGSDFKVQTATCTASVRGTEIEEISYQPGTGTTVQMGDEGHMQVQTISGNVVVGPDEHTAAASANDTPQTSGQLDASSEQNAQTTNLTGAETTAANNAGVPLTGPLNETGAGATSNMLGTVQNTLGDQAAVNAANETATGTDLNGNGTVAQVGTGTHIRTPPGITLPPLPGVVVPNCCPNGPPLPH